MSDREDLIAIIEDVPEACNRLKEDIEARFGMGVITAGTASEGLEMVEKNLKRLRLVILDLGLPERKDNLKDHNQGIRVLGEIKRIAPYLQVIIVTGTKKEVEWVVRAMRGGAFDYLVKEAELFDRLGKDIEEIIEEPGTPDVSEEFAYISENMPEIQEKYGGKWIAVLDKGVVAFGEDADLVYEEAKGKYPNRTPLLDLVPKEKGELLI
ncbi:MAG: DUF5678 domain-containing protein [bacterium]